jgi:(p)ppGpp synthase/HD superfamily hydrolase
VAKFLLIHLENPSYDMLVSSILHDTLEDTKTTYDEISDKFGNRVASIVKELTDDMSLSYDVRKKIQVDHAFYLTYEAGCIKIADKYCNIWDILNTTIGWPRSRKIQYVKWAVQVVERIQNKNQELEKLFYQIMETASEKLKTEINQ